jgi:hypothetical protein
MPLAKTPEQIETAWRWAYAEMGQRLTLMQGQGHIANARQNLAIQTQSQSLTNAQLTGLSRILRVERKAQKSLPPPPPEPPPGLVFDDGIFAGLNEDWD